MDNAFRNLPSVDKLLSLPGISAFADSLEHEYVISMMRGVLERERAAIGAGGKPRNLAQIEAAVIAELEAFIQISLRPVINAAGIVIHTNLGRAPLSPDTVAAMSAAGTGFSNLEFNLESGARGSRHVHIERLLCLLTGAEAALVVNNNASGVMLGLSALARRREVIVSRGQAVEIGGSFRIPDVMRQSGARLVEVGTTNCTYGDDYEQAAGKGTAAIMRVHSSNFKVVGFTAEATLEEMIAVGERHGLPVLDDLGSGCFLDTSAYGLEPEPTVPQSVAAGAACVFFSGDKLVGGPQAGIIVGKKVYIDKLKRHPLARAVRIDKVRLAGLSATLIHYLKGEAEQEIPVWRMISAPSADIKKRAEAWAEAIGPGASLEEGETMVGGGSLPGGSLATWLVAVSREGQSTQALARLLRRQTPAVVGRVGDDRLMLDPRTVLPEEDTAMTAVLRRVFTDI